jgi:hypothetical protein
MVAKAWITHHHFLFGFAVEKRGVRATIDARRWIL